MNQESGRYKKISEERLELLHQFKQTNDIVHHRLLDLEERVRQLNRAQGKDKETSEALKKILKEIEDMDEVVYNDVKKTKVSEPVQMAYGKDIPAKLQ